MTGDWLARDCNLAELLALQLTAPVRFREAVEVVAAEADLLVEVGPGSVLTHLAAFAGKPVVSSHRIEDAIAAAWLAGADVDLRALFADRFVRPFDLDARPAFIVSPAERNAPVVTYVESAKTAVAEPAVEALALRELVAKHVDLPLDLVQPTSKLLSDLHLSSITVARLLAEAARAMGVPPLADPMSFANATIEEATAALEALRGVETPEPESRFAEGIESWLRAFRIDDVPAACGPRIRNAQSPAWEIAGDWPAATARFATVPGRGIVVVLPEDDPYACMELLLDARRVRDGERLVIVQQAACGSGFAKTLHIERPQVSVRVVTVQALDGDALEHVVSESTAASEFCEATYRDGVRYEPRVRVTEAGQTQRAPLGENDVLLVTGGGKGIGFETALHFAKTTGARLLLLGRSTDDDELRANFARLDAARVRYEYVVADVTKPLPRFSGVTAILHAAGTNAPALLDVLDGDAFRKAVAPKLDGLRNALGAVDADALKMLVTFGSVIARTGMRGEAHYAFANEWLARFTADFAAAHPRCNTICIEYSVWAGMGMGERLGTMDMLRRQGIAPIAPDAATALALRLASAPPAAHVMACGRLGEPSTLRFDAGAPPLLRFVEQARIDIPRVELVADAELSSRNDPYLDDHAFGGEPLFPAVAGLEAMVQVARAATGAEVARIDDVELLHPVTASTLRIASIVEGDAVRVAIRTSATQFRLDHFRARITTGSRDARPRIDIPSGEVELAPETDLYGPLLFHTGRFRRVRGYRVLTATHCVAEISGCTEPAFHRYLPSQLLLGDLTIRDAAIHALQASVPQATVLPAGIASIELFAPVEGDAIVVARETARDEHGFVWDVDLASPDGLLFERWRGLRLQIVARRERVDDLAPALWGPFLERELGVRIEVAADALTRVAEAPVVRRKDGKPFVDGKHVSASHDGGIGLAVAAERPIGCDVQLVDDQPWHEILGDGDHSLADICTRLSGDELPFAAARVWSARESMKKLAGDPLVPLVVDHCGGHGRVTFRAGRHHVHTFVMRDCVVAVAKE